MGDGGPAPSQAKRASAKALLVDESGGSPPPGELLRVNQAYAKRLAHNKEREALHRLQELKKRGVVDSSDESSDNSDDGLLPAHTEAKIFDTLAKIKKKDPSIYSQDAKFFDEDEDDDDSEEDDEKEVAHGVAPNGAKKHKPVYLKDALARQLIEDGSDFDEDDPKKGIVTYAQEQQELKDEFLRSAKLQDNDDDDDGGNYEGDAAGFLKLRKKAHTQPHGEATEHAANDLDIAQRLEEYFGGDDNLDENEKFLKEYLLKKSWVDEDADRIPSYEEIIGDVIDDEEQLEKQDRFEAEYNFRYEENMESQVMGHSRVVEDSVRRKDDARRQKRMKKKERLSEAAFERREELKRLKNIKKKEILEKLEKIRTVAGAKDSDRNLLESLRDEDLEEDFDPEEYDRKMREAFGEEYYGEEDADEKFQGYDMDDLEEPDFDAEDSLLGLPKGWDEDEAGGKVTGFAAAREKAKEVKFVASEHDSKDDKIEEPEDSEEVADLGEGDASQSQGMSKRKKKAKVSLREKLAFDKQLEEYYKLDYEDIIGDLPTRFKYRQVKPSMYGLSASKILAADDKDLNQFVSLKKLAPYVTEEWKPKWRFQLSPKKRKKKALQQRIPTQRADQSSGPFSNGVGDVEGPSSSSSAKHEGHQMVSGVEGSRNKKKRRKKGLSLSESRLIAYGKISLPSKKWKRG